ncbi:MAG: hypothetical protein IJD49_04200 [Clostridia bacterium]|nr:hypothetical protein [Clostridia bacterium]
MANAIQIAKLPDGTKAYLELNSVDQILKDKGLTADGSVQAFHTNNVMRRMYRYMPRLTAATVKVMIAQTDINKPYIILDVPFGKYIYHGKVMTGPAPKTVTDTPLNYTKTQNPRAGPYWDRALSAAEGAAMVRDLQNYINRKNGG